MIDDLPKSPGRTALQQGLIFGVILAALIITLNSIISLTGFSAQLTLSLNRGGQMSANQATQVAAFLVSAPSYVFSIVIYFIVGWRAARLIGKASTGALAGLWTGLVMSVLVGLIDIAYLLLVTLPAVTKEYSVNHMSVSPAYTSSLVGSTLTGGVAGLLLSLVLGAGIGALGGLLGKDQNGSKNGGQQDGRGSTTRERPYNNTAARPGQPL